MAKQAQARQKKLDYFFERIPQGARVLDVGCASGWVEEWARPRGWDVVGLDVRPPADIVGDITQWRDLGLEPHSFDVIVAFEVVEHGDISGALRDLLKPDGLLMVTTPVPRWDWFCELLERLRILQPRVGEHSWLVDLREYPQFTVVDYEVRGVIAQWGILAPAQPADDLAPNRTEERATRT